MEKNQPIELPEDLCRKIESCGLAVSDEIEDAVRRILSPTGVPVVILKSRVR